MVSSTCSHVGSRELCAFLPFLVLQLILKLDLFLYFQYGWRLSKPPANSTQHFRDFQPTWDFQRTSN